jgi:hypothetical protein
MLDSDHGGGDPGGGDHGASEAPIVVPADAHVGRDTYSVIEDKSTGLRTTVSRTFEQGEDGRPRPVLKITTRPMTDLPKDSD